MTILLQAFGLFHISVLVVFTFRLLLRDDLTSAARLAWFFVLFAVPFGGIIAYLLFGEISLGRTIHRRHDEIFTRIRQLAGDAMGSCENLDGNVEVEYQAAFRAASVDGFETTLGNRAELATDAASARSRLIDDIDNATKSVHCLYYIWLDDDTGTNVANALMRAAKRGLKCRAMADGLGSRAIIRSQVWRDMREAGVELAVALPLTSIIGTILFSRIDLRNHRKITVIDSKIAWFGSQNCADPIIRTRVKYSPWIDIMLRFEGPVVSQSQLLFGADWLLNSGQDIPAEITLPKQSFEDGFPAQIFADGPTDRRGATPQLFATLMTLAKRELVISTPYFVPSATVLDALCAAAIRGVDVKMIFPKKNDSWIVAAASHSYYRRLLEHGVQIFEFNRGMLHAKTLTVDRTLTLVGSTNLDIRSFDLNYENDILFRDDKLTQAVFDRQQDFLSQADVITLEDVEAWSCSRRIWNNVIATVGPIL